MKGKLALLGLALAALAPGHLMAADMAVKATPVAAPVYSSNVYGWSGTFFEAFALYGAALHQNSAGASNSALVEDPSTLTANGDTPSGPGLGAGFGYRYQIGRGGLVLIGEVQQSYANLRSGGNASNNIGQAISFNHATNYLGAVTGGLGIPVTADGRLLASAYSGFAWGGDKPDLNAVGFTDQQLVAAASQTRVGYVVGGRLDFQLDHNWGLYGATEFYDLGRHSLSAALPSGTVIATADSRAQFIVTKIGFGYKFPAN